MAKQKSSYDCQECGYKSPKWLGKCPGCAAWNSFEEKNFERTHSSRSVKDDSIPLRIGDVGEENHQRFKTGMEEFDRVLGGGIAKASLTLIGGEPGVGKSTLLLEACGRLLKNYPGHKVLYVSGEESSAQVAGRSRRLGVNGDNFFILNENNWQIILRSIQKLKPDFLVLDSIQTTVSPEVASAPGSISQVREVTHEIMVHCKASGLTCFVVGHVTKEGGIAGPKVLEHMVDATIYFEGDSFGQYRILRPIKNRFGSTGEVGIFEMGEKGLREVANPSVQFLKDDDDPESFGRSLTCVFEGSRSLMAEIQALVVENRFGSGKRTTQGMDQNRLSLLVAVCEKYFGIPFSAHDLYINVVGGLKLDSRTGDLAVLASLLSSFYNRPLPSSTVFIGEVGLTGEVRPVPMGEKILSDIARLNYQRVVTSEKTAAEFKEKSPMEFIGLRKASELKTKLF